MNVNHFDRQQRRRRTTADQRSQWIERYHQSGLSRSEFAREHGLKLSTFHQWLAKGRAPSSAKPFPGIGFQELGLGFASAWKMELDLGRGLTVRYAEGFSPEQLAQLLRSL